MDQSKIAEEEKKQTVEKELFHDYIGLKLAMSITQLNCINYFWSTKVILQNDFK